MVGGLGQEVKRISSKRQQRIEETREWRYELVMRVGRCERCGRPSDTLACHEIARGMHRQAALDAAYAILVLCNPQCHEEVSSYSRARQLALLYHARPSDFDLPAFWKLTSRRWPELDEVMIEAKKLIEEIG